jgi:hypothetical protein
MGVFFLINDDFILKRFYSSFRPSHCITDAHICSDPNVSIIKGIIIQVIFSETIKVDPKFLVQVFEL